MRAKIVLHTVPLEKFCPGCKQTKPASSFGPRKDRRSGLLSRCFECRRRQGNLLAKNRSSNQYTRNWSLLKKYGISVQEYAEMFLRQNGLCAICGRTVEQAGLKVLVVDHDHSSGKNRGLLCRKCNSGLGQFDDDPVALRNALTYLLKHLRHMDTVEDDG